MLNFFGATFCFRPFAIALLLPLPFSYHIATIMHFIMSSNSPQDGTSGHKHPLENQNDEAFAFVISQDDAMSMNDEEASPPRSNKRQRIMEPESPGVVSITSTAVMDVSMTGTASTNASKPIEWWKQKPSIAKSNAATPSMHHDQKKPSMNTDTACFICQKPRHYQQQEEHASQPSNSLLSYFPTTKGGSTSIMSIADTKLPAKTEEETTCFHKCSFCDRQACTSCTRQCERCRQLFCSLCSTADYSSRVERSFCLDCLAGEKREYYASGMNIG